MLFKKHFRYRIRLVSIYETMEGFKFGNKISVKGAKKMNDVGMAEYRKIFFHLLKEERFDIASLPLSLSFPSFPAPKIVEMDGEGNGVKVCF